MGVHERYNRRWAIENGPGLKQRDPRHAEYWMREWLNEGTLAAAAWYGFLRMPKFGLYQILETGDGPGEVTGPSGRDQICRAQYRGRLFERDRQDEDAILFQPVDDAVGELVDAPAA